MWKYLLFIVATTWLASCGADSAAADDYQLNKEAAKKENSQDTIQTENPDSIKTSDGKFLLNGKDTLFPVDKYNKNIFWDLKYASSDNFMHRVLYDTLDVLYLQADVVRRLTKIQDKLSKENPGLHLLVYDGVRPLSVQWEMWNALDTIPPGERGKFVSNPANGSIHNYGAAVDLTICDANKKVLDMGADYDDIRKIAYPSLEKQFLASGELTQVHVSNRQLLRRMMQSEGFTNIPSEWWHFNAYSRSSSKVRYTLVRHELLPN